MTEENRGGGTGWKIAISALIGVFLVAMAASLVVAGRRVSRVVDPDYYSHGLNYGQERKSGVLVKGWRLSPSLSGDSIQVVIADGRGVPVTGGTMTLDLAGTAGSGAGRRLPLTEQEPGVYRSSGGYAFRGVCRGTMRFARENTVVCEKVVVFN